MIVPAEKLHFYRLCGTSMYSKVLGHELFRENRTCSTVHNAPSMKRKKIEWNPPLFVLSALPEWRGFLYFRSPAHQGSLLYTTGLRKLREIRERGGGLKSPDQLFSDFYTEAEFLDVIGSKVLRVFPLAIHSPVPTNGFYLPPPLWAKVNWI